MAAWKKHAAIIHANAMNCRMKFCAAIYTVHVTLLLSAFINVNKFNPVQYHWTI